MEKLAREPFECCAPRDPSPDEEQLFVHVIEWRSAADAVTPVDNGRRVGWTEVWRNPKYGWHIHSRVPSLVAFRRPGDDESSWAQIDAWKTIGELPAGRGCLRWHGSSSVDCGSVSGSA